MRKTNIILLIIFCLSVFIFFIENSCFSEDPARVLLEETTKETDVNIAINKLGEIIEKYPQSPLVVDVQFLIAEYKYLKGDYGESYLEFQNLLKKFPGSKYASLVWCRKGQCLLAENKFDEAIKEFSQSLSLGSRSEHSVLARIGIADAYFAKDDYRQALKEYKWISGGQFQPYISYKIALCYKKLKNEKEFETSKKELLKKYPRSLEAVLIENIQETEVVIEQIPTVVQPISRTTETVKVVAEAEWTIQVGSFTKVENARSLRDSLKKKGYISWIEPVKIGEGFFYRVYLGRFKTTEEEMKKKAQEIAHKENLPTRLVEIK